MKGIKGWEQLSDMRNNLKGGPRMDRHPNVIKQILVSPDNTLVNSLQRMNDAGLQLLLVIDAEQKLVGTVTDGDVRRALLRGKGLDVKISEVMFPRPVVFKVGTPVEKIREVMLQRNIRHIPLVDNDGRLTDLLLWTDLFEQKTLKRNEKIIVMAGGKGTRLDPFTKILPKPLIPLGDRPVIEIIMDGFYSCGFADFTVSLGYKADIMRLYFLENDHRPYSVNFIQEKEPLGTAGSLSLLEGQIDTTCIVTNCDIVLKVDYADILAYHNRKQNDFTVIGAIKNFTIPYGVLQLENEELKYIDEKPSKGYFVNTGVYVMEPGIISLVPKLESMQMTELIVRAKNAGFKVGVYPFKGQWFDVGQWEDYRKTLNTFEYILEER
jgi:dTDP-glucose pyrophosphorylase